MDSVKKNLEKVGLSLYNLFDHLYIKIIVITLLVIYNSGLFVDYNLYLSSLFNNTLIRLIILLIIVGISTKNITISLLLVLALALSTYYRAENFESMYDEEDNKEKNKEKEKEKDSGKDKKRINKEKFNNSNFVKRESFTQRR